MTAPGPALDPVSAYLERAEPADRAALLRHLRDVVVSEVPDAEPVLSYGVAAFRVRGGVVCGFAATKSGCSLYPFSGTTLGRLGTLLEGRSTTKSAIHFDSAHPLADDLIREVVRLRLAEIGERSR